MGMNKTLKYTPMEFQDYVNVIYSKGYNCVKSMSMFDKLVEMERCFQDLFNKRPAHFKRCLSKIDATFTIFKVAIVKYVEIEDFGSIMLRLDTHDSCIYCFLYYYDTRFRIYIPTIGENNIENEMIRIGNKDNLSEERCMEELKETFNI